MTEDKTCIVHTNADEEEVEENILQKIPTDSTSQKKESNSNDESSGSEVEPDLATSSASPAPNIDPSSSDSSSVEETPVVSKPPILASASSMKI